MPDMIITSTIGSVIGSLIAAIVLRAAAKWVEKREVPYGQAYVTVLLPSLISGVLVLIVSYFGGSATLVLPVGFLILSGFISSRLEIPFGSACLVALAMVAIGIGIALIVVIGSHLIVELMN
jgi:hypothetical protein